MNCISCTLNLCTIYLDCDNEATIDMNSTAPVDGEYVLYLKYLNVVLSFTKTFLQNDKLVFDLSRLNEDYCYSFHIVVNGEKLFVNNGIKSYGNFNFCTRKQWKIS